MFAGEATFLINRAQAEDLATKGAGYLEMFRGLGEPVARQLEGVELATPDVVYDKPYDLDLGGRVAQLRATGRAHSNGDQVVAIPDAGVMFTGDLAEAGQFAIFPWFPPHDTDVSGTRWIAVMQRLAAKSPQVVVPGHGDVGGPQLLADVRDYLQLLRDETWARRDSAMSEETIVAEVSALMIERHPDWSGQEWISRASAACGRARGVTGPVASNASWRGILSQGHVEMVDHRRRMWRGGPCGLPSSSRSMHLLRQRRLRGIWRPTARATGPLGGRGFRKQTDPPPVRPQTDSQAATQAAASQ